MTFILLDRRKDSRQNVTRMSRYVKILQNKFRCNCNMQKSLNGHSMHFTSNVIHGKQGNFMAFLNE